MPPFEPVSADRRLALWSRPNHVHTLGSTRTSNYDFHLDYPSQHLTGDLIVVTTTRDNPRYPCDYAPAALWTFAPYPAIIPFWSPSAMTCFYNNRPLRYLQSPATSRDTVLRLSLWN